MMTASIPIRLMLAAGLCCASTDAMGQALQWQVSEAAGPVMIRHAGTDRPATRGAVLAPGDAVFTGVGGRAVLVHERDFVTLAPRSRTTVPAADQAGGFTKLLQDLGNAVYKIEKRGVPHFGVTTPYLAAVVKGTTFSVTVDISGTSLQVVEGAVEVATPDGGARDLIRPGSVATIAASDLFRLRVHGDEDRVVDSAARPGANAPSTPAGAPLAAPAAAIEPVATASDGAVVTTGTDVVISAAITSKPVDLGELSGGLMTGTAGVGTLTASVNQAARSPAGAVAAAVATTSPVAPVVTAPAVAVAVTTPVDPAVTTPVLAAVAPAVIAPAVTTTPVAAAPVVAVAVVAAPVITPVVTAPTVAAPVVAAVTTPVVTTPPAVAPVVSAPVVAAVVATPAVTIPAVTTPAVTTPVVVPAVVTTPVVTPVVTTPVVAPVVVVKPVVTVPVVTLPIIATIIKAVDGLDDDLGGSGKGNSGRRGGGHSGKD